MIAVIDIGNTRTKIAYGALAGIEKEESFPTTEAFLERASRFFPAKIEKAVIGSVVPSSTGAWADFFSSRAGKVHVASSESPWGFRNQLEEPSKVGIDRLANLEGALAFPGSVIIVDAGTATKFDVLEGVETRSFPGGAIAPGMGVSYEALMARAAQLAPIDLEKHSPVVGYNTETAIRSGVLHGFAAQVDGMVSKIFAERSLVRPCTVVATGGNSSYLRARAQLITQFRPRLTLEGLYALSQKI